MNNTRVARITFDFNRRDDEDVYFFNIPENLEDIFLTEKDILLVDTKYGARFGYCDWYYDKSKIDFEPEKSLICRNESRVPYGLDDEFFELEGFILIEINGKYLPYNFKDKGLVGILNHMITNNIASSCVKTTPKDFEPVSECKYFNISIYTIDSTEDYPTGNIMCKYTVDDKITLVYFKEFDTRMNNKLSNSMDKTDIKYLKDTEFNIDCKSILNYGRDIYDIIDKRMMMNGDIFHNYYYAFREINSSFPVDTKSTFGYIINSNYESADVFEFRSTPELGVYLPYFILNHEIDGSTLGQGYIDDDEEDEDDDEE